MSTHLPLRIFRRPLHRQCLFLRPQPHPHAAIEILVQISVANNNGRRQLSSTPCVKRVSSRKDPSGHQNSYLNNVQESPASAIRKMMADPDWLQDDHGLPHSTYVRLPLWEQVKMMRSWKGVLGFLYYQWRIVKQRVIDLFLRSRYKWWIKKGSWKTKPKLARGPIKRDAKVLYETLWKAFAQKDEEQLSEICCSSIMEPLRGQWAARPPNHVISWKLEKYYLGSPRVVSNKAQDIDLANFRESALRQVVIRFKTRQTVTTRILPQDMKDDGEDGDGWVKNPVERTAHREYRYRWTPDGPKDVTEKSEEDEVKTSSKTVDVVEYMIVQRIMKRGVEGEWKVYGFAQPTTLESIAENDEFIKKSEAFMNAHPELMDG